MSRVVPVMAPPPDSPVGRAAPCVATAQ